MYSYLYFLHYNFLNIINRRSLITQNEAISHERNKKLSKPMS